MPAEPPATLLDKVLVTIATIFAISSPYVSWKLTEPDQATPPIEISLYKEIFQKATLGTGIALFPSITTGYSVKEIINAIDSAIVPMNGTYHFKPFMKGVINIPLQKPLQNVTLHLSEEYLINLYAQARNMQHNSYLDFIDYTPIEPIAKIFLNQSKGDKIKYIQDVLTFVTNNVRYTKDTTRYYHPSLLGYPIEMPADFPKFPLQTINDKTGDCEDFSILFASFLAYNHIETGLAISPNHAATGFVLEETDDLDQLVFDAVKKALGEKFKNTPNPREIETKLQVTSNTSLSQLESIIKTNAPLILGKRLTYDINISDKESKELPANVPCEEPYWTGDFTLTFQDLPEQSNFIGTNQRNTFQELLNDAVERRTKDQTIPKIQYRLPSNSTTYIIAYPIMTINRQSTCKPSRNQPKGNLVYLSAKEAKFKPKKIYYIEPQVSDFILHKDIPPAIMWLPLPANKYPQK